ncbi:MAG: type II toxin-antitoxin system RelE/ParE family toxin [Chloracidobacterium sp.]|nr:type II toxin-antitoxin system RelE/ParE family toxin [Chloracidobacterium sp.]
MRVAYDECVLEELIELAAYLANDNEDVAQRFLNACDDSFQLLAKNPLIGSVREFNNPELSRVRMWRVKGFEKYLIFYVPIDDGIKILHLFHSARDYESVFEDDA